MKYDSQRRPYELVTLEKWPENVRKQTSQISGECTQEKNLTRVSWEHPGNRHEDMDTEETGAKWDV